MLWTKYKTVHDRGRNLVGEYKTSIESAEAI